MNKFFSALSQLKSAVALTYTASLCLAMVCYAAFGGDAIPISMLFQLLLVSLCASILQTVCFTDLTFRKLSYTLRTVLFLAAFFAVLTAFALVCRWFPAGYPMSWLIFAGGFFLLGGVIMLGFEIYYRISGRKYDGLLGEYRRTHEGEKSS